MNNILLENSNNLITENLNSFGTENLFNTTDICTILITENSEDLSTENFYTIELESSSCSLINQELIEEIDLGDPYYRYTKKAGLLFRGEKYFNND